MKSCSKYDNEKELSEFNFRKDLQTYRNECIRCYSIKQKKWRDNNLESKTKSEKI